MERNKIAFVLGATGQDGFYMCQLLASKGYIVHAAVRLNVGSDKLKELEETVPSIQIYKTDYSKVRFAIQYIKPDEIYNFIGVSDTFRPWENMTENIELNALFPIKILRAIHAIDPSIRFFQASSCLVFGKDKSGEQDENTPRNPIHPYGVFKNTVDQMIKLYREEHSLFACSGILFPHESPRRGDNFFTKKVCMAVARIKNGSDEKIKVGDLTQVRDWLFAPDVVNAAWRMLQHDKPMDYVVGSGELTTLQDFLLRCFRYVGLNGNDYIEHDESLVRKSDLQIMKANTRRIEKELGWGCTQSINGIIRIMMDAELEKLKIKNV